MPDIKHLYELQETDLNIAGRETEIAGVESDLADESTITKARAELEKTTEYLQKLQADRRDCERESNSITEKLQKIENRLYRSSQGTQYGCRNVGAVARRPHYRYALSFEFDV